MESVMNYDKEILGRAQIHCGPPASTNTDRATTQLAIINFRLKVDFFILVSLISWAIRVGCSLLSVGISPNCRMVLSVF